MVAVVVLAGGLSQRMMGRDKLLMEVDGIPLLRRAAQAALDSQASETVITVCKEHDARRQVVQDLPVRLVSSGTPARGMAGSIRAGIEAVSDKASGALLLLPDMPEIEARDINTLIENSGSGAIVRAASEDGRPGNPVLFPRELFLEICKLKGDKGAKLVVTKHASRVRTVRLARMKALLDLDTPEQWDAWLQGRRRQTHIRNH